MLVTLREVLADAVSHRYAVGAFNVIDTNMARGVIAGAEQCRSPVIISQGQGQFRFTPPEIMGPSLVQLAREASVPVVIHLDHGKQIDVCERAIRAGYSSIMYDGSQLPLTENMAYTRQAVSLARKNHVSIEGEVGHVSNAETGDLPGEHVQPAPDEQYLTTPEQARAFWQATEVDALAVAFGTGHGLYRETPRLEFNRLREIHQAADVPLVMHGGSGLGDEAYQEAIACGIRKLNYFTLLSQSLGELIKEATHATSEPYYHELQLLVVHETQKHVARLMGVFGSARRA
ncbi:class II fructose-bisphosphate aldolase [Enterobacteriaceae bacterium YMB-R22]|jgi:fructose-bisphosphate aldolase class II|uniref:class II fructose-bisphosphate aldolase n=1 Tax=Tenebrionicola larvae TaxID=2815733 RepID=UPI0020139863|nr:class II fructose-bisphosphate aldolase [Tenebrionicola larvae]MBV4412831.1 class II fructose-bisphosphate aldolase [Tenebrionicola larvae]